MKYLKLFNTSSRKKEEVRNKKIRMYTCGPTVYDYAHIGNFRTYLFEDLLRRTLKYLGYEVRQVMNITDVDDKTIQRAYEEKVALDTYTRPFIQAFFEDIDILQIERAEDYPRATHYIPQMIALIDTLLKKGHAYLTRDGSVYFSLKSFPAYGKLSHLNFSELKTVEQSRDEYDKEAASDFVLWKTYDPLRDGSVFWDSPFGKGRPGWHIECSAMAMALLGDTIDIHCGGVDNMFPHHENEVAQSECSSGKVFVLHWVHVEHLLVHHKKMSKSLGNFFTLRDLIQKGYHPLEIRYLLLQGHYRTQLNFTFQELEAVKMARARISDFVFRLQAITSPKKEETRLLLKKAKEAFVEAILDDINASLAFSVIFDLIREVNTLCDQDKIGQEDAKNILTLLSEFDSLFSCLPLHKKELSVPEEVQRALEQREEARKKKDFSLADSLRDYIYEKGYVIDDTPQGLRLKPRD